MGKNIKGVGIIPLLDRVLIEEIEGGEIKTASGIIIPQSASNDGGTKKGKVVAVGEGRMVDGKLQKPNVKDGDVVLYSWGDEIKVNEKKYTLVGGDNVIAIIQ